MDDGGVMDDGNDGNVGRDGRGDGNVGRDGSALTLILVGVEVEAVAVVVAT